MPITPGSSAKLNTVHGLSSVMKTTSAEETALATKILPAGILVKKSDGKIYLTDGVSTLANIPVLIDRVLANIEKIFLSSAVSNGAYTRAAGGVVVHGNDGKISDDSLNIVTSGKITESYLSDYIDPVTHKVLLSALPDTVRAGVTYVADIDARDALSAEQKKSLAFVIDATDDETVESGVAMYGWDTTANDGDGAWIKIAEVESLDLDIDAIRCDYNNVETAGAIMYDHTVHLHLNTATEFANLIDASGSTDEVTDTVHDESQDFTEQSWAHFITGFNTMANNASSGDVYMDLDDEEYTDYIVVESDHLNPGSTTLTIANDVTGVSTSVSNSAAISNVDNRLVITVPHPGDSDYPGILNTDGVEGSQNQSITLTLTDGTYTYRNNSYTRETLRYAIGWEHILWDVDSDSDWQSV